MDNSSTRAAWATQKSAVAALAVGAVALAIAAVAVTSDPPGRALIGLAALALVVLAVMSATQRPRLAVDGGELRIKTVRGARSYHRVDVVRVRLVPYPRFGRRVPMLEIDVRTPGASPAESDDTLYIFGRWDLGTDPRNVFESLDDLGFVPDSDSER